MATIRFRCLCVTFLLVSSQVVAMEDPYTQFIGDWELVSYVVYPEEGGKRVMDYVGYLSYDAHGNMAGLGMPRDLPQRLDDGEQSRSGFAYWGGVSVDAEDRRVIHHVQGSPTQPQWVGGDNIRFYEFEGSLLKLSLKDEAGRVSGTLTWRRLP